MTPNIPFVKEIQLSLVDFWVKWLNFWLNFFQKILFCRKIKEPKNILIYKVGNIGDIICAVPSFIAIRRFYPKSKITILTSPGKIGAPGAKELLNGVWYLDELKIYYGEDIDFFEKKKNFIGNLRKNRYDLFIQLPDDLTDFRTLLRNMIFAKLTGVKMTLGFKIRTVQLFKKTQVDYMTQKTEVESLLELLAENGIKSEKVDLVRGKMPLASAAPLTRTSIEVEFDFNVSTKQKNKIEKLLKKKWPRMAFKKLLIAISPGGKRETNQWPIERFAELAKYLSEKYDAKIVVVGGKNDIEKAEVIRVAVGEKNTFIACGELDFLETFELLKFCSFLISNSTGAIHLAAAAGILTVGLCGIRDVFGRWFPYGKNHKILYHKFLDCDYKKEDCIKNSIEMISVDEAKNACDELINKIKM